MHGRDEKKTLQVFEEVKAESGNADITMYTADLSLKDEVDREVLRALMF